MQIKELINKLSNPHWFTGQMQVDLKPDTQGAFNLYWLLCKMPPVEIITVGYMRDTKPLWIKAHSASKLVVDGVELEYSATVLKPGELYSFMVKHGAVKAAQEILSQGSP